jgi:PAS domain S-box-containing protein
VQTGSAAALSPIRTTEPTKVMSRTIQPTKREVFFDEHDIIVSKTDLKGRITYANQTFCKISSYLESEVVGQPHSIVRHPDMPRAVFKLLWDTLAEGREIFAYVKNISKVGDFYWVFAHVTPSRGKDGMLCGFHSNRRVPDRNVVDNIIEPLYASILQEENTHRNGQAALAAGYARLTSYLKAKNTDYDQFIFSL